MSKIKVIFNNIKQFISNNDAEITACISAFFIVYASFLLNIILGCYMIGCLFALVTMFLLKYPR